MHADCYRSSDVGRIVGPCEMGFQGKQGLGTFFLRDSHPDKRMGRIGRQHDRARIPDPIVYHFHSGAFRSHTGQYRIIRIDKGRTAVRSEPIVQLAFGILDSFETAESEQVCLTHVRNQTIVRIADGHEPCNVLRMARTHLYHCELRIRSYRKEGKRYTYIVVEVTLGSSHLELGRKHGSDEFLRGGLPVGPSQPYDSQPFAIYESILAVIIRKGLEGFERVLDRNDSLRNRIHRGHGRSSIHHSEPRPLFQSFQRIFITVEVLPLQREEHFTAGYRAAVRRHPGALPEQRIQILYFHLQDYLLPVLPQPPAPRSVSERTSTSSHSTVS